MARESITLISTPSDSDEQTNVGNFLGPHYFEEE